MGLAARPFFNLTISIAENPFVIHAVSPCPDLVLLDLRMPRIDGFGVLEVVKRDPALKATPVIILTTSSSEKDRSTAEHCGVDGYLTKPFDYEGFISLIEELCVSWLDQPTNQR